MKKERMINRIVWSIAALLLAVLLCFSYIPVYAFAETSTEYSNVLDDLQKDESFSASNYPVIRDPQNENYGMLSVIQVAESVDKELFIYVYQPSGQTKKLKASSINISLSRSYSIDVHNYKLEYCNSDGVFYKYKVCGLTVKEDETRYYTIVSILRPFDESIDEQASGDNTITEVVYDVSKEYCLADINGTSYTNCFEIETIRVTDKFVGYVYYPSGFLSFNNPCHSHFVAFNTDKPIDRLLEAKVYYTHQDYNYRYEKNGIFDLTGTKTETYGSIIDEEVSLKYTDKAEYDQGGWFGQVYTWDRIQTVEDFIDTEDREKVYHMIGFDITTRSNLTDEALTELQGKKWVLRFVETSSYYSDAGNSADGSVIDTRYGYTMVGDVSILELKFETDGIVYHLGVIDNKQTGSRDPVNEWDTTITPSTKRLWHILAILAVLVLCLLLIPILTPLIGLVINIISLPFKFIGWLFRGNKK